MQLARQQGRHSKRGIGAKRFKVDTDFTSLLGRKGTELFILWCVHILLVAIGLKSDFNTLLLVSIKRLDTTF